MMVALSIIFTLLMLAIVLHVKNTLTHIAAMKYLYIMFAHKDVDELYVIYKREWNYDKCLFNPFKWTYKQMFPWMSDYEKEEK